MHSGEDPEDRKKIEFLEVELRRVKIENESL